MSTVPISTIVNVQISRQSQGVTQAGFGVPLVLTNETPVSPWGAERVREYSNIEEVLDDWTSSDDAYLASLAIFSQNPKVEKVKIALEATRVAQIQTMVFSADLITGNTAAGEVDGVAVSQAFSVDHLTTITALAASIQAQPGVATAVVGGVGNRTITITAQNAGVPVELTGWAVTGGASQATITITTTTANHGVSDDLSEISEEDDDWYGLIWIERTQVYVEQGAAAIEALRKIFITCTDDADVLDDTVSTDIASVLSAANYERTAVIWNDDPADFADAAWMGKLFPFDPGNETWKFKTLAGITADDLTSSERSAAQDKNANIYVTIGGVDMTEEGVMASGEFIDVIRGVDWLQARMEERVFSKLVNLPKVPYTDGGIAIIEAEIRAVLLNAVSNQLLSPDPLPDNEPDDLNPFRVGVPKAADVSALDRANRFLPDITFTARLAGAIHRVTIQGVVTV